MPMLKFTTADCEKLLPEALVNYLWQLAAEYEDEDQIFVLTVRHIGTGEVQDILHRRESFSSWRRVFGYQPVEATVEVRATQFGAIMSLQSEERDEQPPAALYRAGQGEGAGMTHSA